MWVEGKGTEMNSNVFELVSVPVSVFMDVVFVLGGDVTECVLVRVFELIAPSRVESFLFSSSVTQLNQVASQAFFYWRRLVPVALC